MTPHFRPFFVEWSVAFWISSLPSASRLTTTTPSMATCRPSSIDRSASYASHAAPVSLKSATKSVVAPSLTAATSAVNSSWG